MLWITSEKRWGEAIPTFSRSMLEPIKTTWRGSKMDFTSSIQIRPSADLGERKRKKHNPFTFINLTGTYFLSIIFMYTAASFAYMTISGQTHHAKPLDWSISHTLCSVYL